MAKGLDKRKNEKKKELLKERKRSRVTAAPNLEAAYLPDADEIILSSENMVNYK